MTPAERPTANCIWNSFRASGKRHLLLTGARGSGKSTLLAGILPLLGGGPVPCLTTWAEPGRAVYLKENLTGRSAQIGQFDSALPGPENRMRPCVDGFRGFGIPALRACGQAAGVWAVIDEIGYLETACPEYCRAILALMARKRLAAVVRKQDLPFLQELCRRPDVFVVDLDAPYGRAGCVIMASGQGKRFGGNKLTAAFRGKTLIQCALDATEGIFAHRVVVTRHREVETLCREQGVPVLLHDQPYRSDTVRLGLQALMETAGAGGLTGCLFCPADQPLLQRQTVDSLALCAAQEPDAIWRIAWQGRDGAPVLFPAWAFPELRVLPCGQGGGAVAKKHPDKVRRLPVQEARELADIDTRAQLDALQKGEFAAFGW